MTKKQKLNDKLNLKLLQFGFTKNELQFLGAWDLSDDFKHMQKLIYTRKAFKKFYWELQNHNDFINSISTF